MLKNLRIGRRLSIVLSLMVVLASAVMAVGDFGMSAINSSLKTVYEDRTVCLVQLSTIERDLFQTHHRLLALIDAADDEQRRSAVADSAAADREIDDMWRDYLSTYIAPDEKSLAANIASRLRDYRAIKRQVIDLAIDSHADAARNLYKNEERKYFLALDDAVHQDIVLQETIAKAEYRKGRSIFHRTMTLNTLATLTGVGLSLALAMIIVREITGSIAEMVAAMRRLADGDTGIDVPGKDRADEIGDMSKAMDIFKVNAIERQQLQAEEKAANRAKSTFLTNMSHELRTPLTSVIGFSQLMTDDPTLNEAHRRKLAIINRSGNHLLSLINDVLQLSKIEAGRMALEPQPTDLNDQIAVVAEMMRGRAEMKGLALDINAARLPPCVNIDGPKLRQVLLNLLANAVKFTESGRVSLEARASFGGQGRVRLDFAVTDTGIGVNAADKERIFEAFVQSGPANALAGTGLGLSISRQYVQMMGGNLALDSLSGGGSVFRFSLPATICKAALVPTIKAGRVTAMKSDKPQRPILIAEDNADIRILLRGLLAPLGFEIYEAKDGAAAVAAVPALKPGLVILDWRMPELDGIDVIKAIRAMDHILQPRIIMLTASAYEEHRQIAAQSGADDFLRKPFEAADLYAQLERHLDVRFHREEIETDIEKPLAATPALTARDLDPLPADQRSALLNAVSELNFLKISSVLQDVGRDQPTLAHRLKAMVDAAKYPDLCQILENAGHPHPGNQS